MHFADKVMSFTVKNMRLPLDFHANHPVVYGKSISHEIGMVCMGKVSVSFSSTLKNCCTSKTMKNSGCEENKQSCPTMSKLESDTENDTDKSFGIIFIHVFA